MANNVISVVGEEGKYYLEGAIILGEVKKRSKGATPVVEKLGFSVSELVKEEKDGELKVVKDEDDNVKRVNERYYTREAALEMILKEGCYNAYVQERKQGDKSVNYLLPLRKYGSAARDDVVISVAKLDEKGNYVLPLQIMIDREKCSAGLWRLIELTKKNKDKHTKSLKALKREKQQNEDKAEQYVQDVMANIHAIGSKKLAVNPFGEGM